MTEAEIAAAMNEWMRRYIADPKGFEREFETVAAFKKEGDAPSYGADCAAYIMKLHAELALS